MIECSQINPEQYNVLEEIENIIDKTIPVVKNIYEDSIGVKIVENNIIGLGLYNCGLVSLPKSIENLDFLQELNLSTNNLRTLPESIEKLNSLKILNLSNNQLFKLPNSIGSCSYLQELNLSTNNLNTLPESIINLKSLQILNLSLANSETFSPSLDLAVINTLFSLKELKLDMNNLSEISGFQDLTNLEFLSLQGNSITEIKGLGTLVNLKELNLAENRINKIDNLESLNQLEILDLSVNEIKEIKGLENLVKLKTISLNSNQITEIKNLECLTNLESLLLNENQISVIDNLDVLENLISLSLNRNNISVIENLEKLTSLKQLDLSGNRIKEIKGIDTLEKLSEFDISYNRIENVKGLENLKKLDIIYLEENKLKPPDDIWVQVFTRGSQIVHYCRRKKRGEIERSGLYSDDKTHSEKIKIFKQELKTLDTYEFVNIGTHNEKENISWKQNMIFYEKKPLYKKLSKRDYGINQIKINLIQMHSLKGLIPKFEDDNNYNNRHFDYFIRRFWDTNEIESRVLRYRHFSKRVSHKIDELLDLSIKEYTNVNPLLLILPENSIPHQKINELIILSIIHNLIIIGGLEHIKLDTNQYINITLIIDKGKIGYQVKQTPIAKKNLKTKEFEYENINCQSFPKIKIFETTIGTLAIFICKDFLRLCDIISDWAWKNDVDFIVIPSLTSKVLPFHYKLLNIFNYTDYIDLKVLFTNVGDYGGSEFFNLKRIKIIEERFRTNVRDNLGEVIITRDYKF